MTRHVMKLPDVGEGVVEAEVVEWKVRIGEAVSEDQHLVDIMTDKATVELTAPVSGVVIERGGEPGDRLRVGSPLLVIETGSPAGVARPEPAEDRAPQDLIPPPRTAPSTPETPRPARDTRSQTAPPQHPQVPREGRRPLAAPTVRRRAREAQVDLAEVHGTGRGGRVSHEDLNRYMTAGHTTAVEHQESRESALLQRSQSPVTQIPEPGSATPPGAGDVQQIRLVGLRRVIAENMARSKRSIPHFTYVEEIDVTELERLRQHLNARHAGQRPKLTYLPFLMLSMVRALREYPQCNAHYDEAATTVTRFAAVHCGIATQTPGGLMVPVVRHCEARDLWDCAGAMQRVAEAARSGKAGREELGGSTITITSLGALGGIVSTPVINYPEVSIIGVNRSVERPVAIDGQIVVRRMMNLSCSFDHRVVDGHDAASFVQRIRSMLEYPPTLFV